MEVLVSKNNDQSQRTSIKTLQGLTQSIQCVCAELPFFFWSGWIINKVNHVNCMAISLGAVAVRMYLFTVISNPSWVLLIELLNGLSYALAHAVKMSYAKMIAPESTCTVVGLILFFEMIGLS